MSTEKQSYTPIPVLAGLSALVGTGKLIGAGPARGLYARSGYSRWRRRAAGAVDVSIAYIAVRGLEDATLRQIAGASALVTTVGALRVRARAGAGALSLARPLLTGALGLATYLDLTLDVEP